MNKEKGFTLIEIMIVLSIIALLAMIMVPKFGGIKIQSKNNSVSANSMIMRSYLENRSGKDAVNYQSAISSGQSPAQSLGAVVNSLGKDMASNFTGSNAIANPFSNKSNIDYSQGDVRSNSSSQAAALLYYSTSSLPLDKTSVTSDSALPKGTGFSGDLIAIVYSEGYVVYGVDSGGQMISIYIINFSKVPADIQSGVISGGANPSILANTGDVVSYIKSIAMLNIITGAPNGQMWNVMQGPLYDGLYNKFTPGNASTHIVNPFYINVDTIGNANSWINPAAQYSIISDPQPGDYSKEDSKYSNRPGTVIVYVTKNPVGYIVYGVNQDGSNVGYTPINLSTLVTAQMTRTLAGNVTEVYNVLKNNIDSNISSSSGNVQSMASLALKELQSLNIANAYLPGWTKKMTAESGTFNSGYALVVGSYDGGASYSDYKGTVIVDTLDDGSGYEIYGMDYMGNKYCDTILKSVNTLVNDNYDKVVSYLSTVSSSQSSQDLQNLLTNNFNTSLVNPYNAAWNTIGLAADGNTASDQYSVIVCDHKISLDYSNYKGTVIVQAHDNSDKHYTVYSIGDDGTVLKQETISFQ